MTAIRLSNVQHYSTLALLAAGLSVTIIGVLALLGWVLDAPGLTTWKAGTLPMSPSAAVLSVLFGAILCLIARVPSGRVNLLLITPLSWLGTIAALLLFTLRLLDVYGSAERLGLSITGTIDDAPIAYISAITAFCFLLANGSLLFLPASGVARAWRVWLAWGFGGLVALISFVHLQAYAYGIPLLFGKPLIIHSALNTSLNLLIIGLALLVLANRYTLRLVAPSDTNAVRLLPYACVFLALTAGITVVTYYSYRETELKFRQEVELQVLAVTELKVNELVRWRLERFGDAILAQSATNSAAVRQLLEEPGSVAAQWKVQDWLGRYQTNNLGYDRAFLLDANGVTRVSASDKAEPVAAALKKAALASLRSGQVTILDFYRDDNDQQIYLTMIVPIFDQQNGNRPLGTVVLRIDPNIYLYPLIKRWPSLSPSAETLLVRKDGNDVVFLNNLRFMANTALNLRFPLTATQLPSAQAVLGKQGIFDGKDYRGVRVIAGLQAVPDSPWHIVARMDAAEIYAPLRERFWLTVLLLSMLLCGVGAVLLLLWRQQRVVFNQRQLESTLAALKSEKLHRSILQTVMDGFWLADIRGRLLEVNDTYCRMSGYSEEELLAMCVADLEALETAEDIAIHIQKIITQGADRFETRHRRKDGSIFNAEVSIQYLPDEGGRFLVFLQDINERKRAEEAMQAIKAQLDFALQMIHTGAWELNLQNNTAQRTVLHDHIFGYEKLLPCWTYEMFLEHVLPEDRPEVNRRFRDAVAAQADWSFECRIRRTDGEVRWIYAAGSHQRDSKGEPKLMSGIVQDITERKLTALALQQSEKKFRTLAEALPQIIWISLADSRVIYFNQQWINYTGLTQEEGIGNGWIDAVHPDDRQKTWDAWQQAVQTDSIYSFESRLRRADGIYRWWLIRAVSLHDENGKITNWFGAGTDIHEIKESEEQLRLAASVFSHASEGIMITSADGTIIDVNNALCQITSYSRDEVLGKNPRLLSSGRQGKDFYAEMWANLIEKGQWYGEIWNRRKSGEVYAVMLNISAVLDARNNLRHYVAMFTDISVLKKHENELDQMAHYDALTSLPNRVLLADRLRQGMAQAKRRSQPLAVAFLDLDGFKAINDDYGHEAGDQLLIIVADRMKQTLREGDTLARLGGDEFVAVLLDLANEIAGERMLNRLLAAAAQPVQFGDIILQVSASLGVTFYPQAEDIDADQLLRQADQAMYQAKQAGKNRYHLFDASLDRNIRGHYETIDRIRHALTAGEFVLYYQPKVDMRKGSVIGVEALIRWQDPERGLLPPALFLPVIEDHPLAVDIGEWVIGTALAQMELWQLAGLNLPVSVNISARQLQQTDFIVRLQELLAAHPNVRHGNLELEVLETSAMEDLVKASGVIDASRKLGVSFALDDFGTGYSSLTYLKRLPVSLLKIDQSFVRNMLDDPDDLAILDGVIGLASAFRLQVIAEGVETVDHGTLLMQLGCNLAQGYGIARPMPADQLPVWLAAWRPDPVWTKLPFFKREDMSLFFASVEHRAWIAAMEKYLKGERETPIPLDMHQCRFGQWLNTEGLSRFGWQPPFAAIERLHRQVHGLATELCRLHSQDNNPEAALARLGELKGLRDALLEQLKALVPEIQQS